MSVLVDVISADMSHLSENLLEDHSIRLYSRGGHFTKDQLIPVYFMLIYGCSDPDSYNNFLYSLRDDIKKTTRPFAFIDTPLAGPDSNERLKYMSIDRSSIQSVISGLCAQINIKNDPIRTTLAQKAIGDMLSQSNTDNIFDPGMALAYKLNLVANAIDVGSSKEIPMIMYYGNPTPEDIFFLCFAQRSGFDVICVSPDKSCLSAFESCPYASKLQKEQFPDSRPVQPFPQKLVKTKIATVAYNAERELDTALYGGDTIFRDRQFDKMDSAVLKTTLDEVFILWDQPAKFRSGFAVRGDRVIVPTIFAKINGVSDGNMKLYWKKVEELLTPDTIYVVKSPSYKRPSRSAFDIYRRYMQGGRIDTEALMRSDLNRYGFLSEPLQSLIFEKMQAIVADGMLELDDPIETMGYVINTALNLDKSVIRLLQKYDYTKEIPKFIVMDTIEEPFSKLECVQLLLFSYLGFDVLVLSPSGYRDIETYVRDEAFETHTLNEFQYNVSVPRLRVPDRAKYEKQKNSVLKNLFKKGR